jgi:hypothetical protein
LTPPGYFRETAEDSASEAGANFLRWGASDGWRHWRGEHASRFVLRVSQIEMGRGHNTVSEWRCAAAFNVWRKLLPSFLKCFLGGIGLCISDSFAARLSVRHGGQG